MIPPSPPPMLSHLNADRPRLREPEPGRAVDDGEEPAPGDDLLGPGDGADALGLHRVADGDVPLDGEGGEGEGGGVDAQVLQVDHGGAAHRAPHPLVPQDVVAQHLLRDGRHQRDGVRKRQAHLERKKNMTIKLYYCR